MPKPVDQTTGERLGGRTYVNASAELQAPLPLVPESFGFRVAAFADAADRLHAIRGAIEAYLKERDE